MRRRRPSYLYADLYAQDTTDCALSTHTLLRLSRNLSLLGANEFTLTNCLSPRSLLSVLQICSYIVEGDTDTNIFASYNM